jgi:hypothetical protein
MRVNRSPIILISSLLGALSPAGALALDDHFLRAPLPVDGMFLLHTGYLAFEPTSAHVLAEDEWRLSWALSRSNSFASSGDVRGALEARPERAPVDLAFLRGFDGNQFFADGEVTRLAVTLERALAPRLQAGATVQVLHLGGGVFDSVIEGFHQRSGFERGRQRGRLGVPRDDFTVFVRSQGKEFFLGEAPGVGIGDILLHAKLGLLDGESPLRVGVNLDIKVPVGDEAELYSSGSADYGAQLVASREFRHGSLHAAVGLRRLGAWELLGIPAQTIASGVLAYGHRIGGAGALVGQVAVSDSPLAPLDIDVLGHSTLQLTLGYQQRLGTGTALSLAIAENSKYLENTADIGLQLGLVRTF